MSLLLELVQLFPPLTSDQPILLALAFARRGSFFPDALESKASLSFALNGVTFNFRPLSIFDIVSLATCFSKTLIKALLISEPMGTSPICDCHSSPSPSSHLLADRYMNFPSIRRSGSIVYVLQVFINVLTFWYRFYRLKWFNFLFSEFTRWNFSQSLSPITTCSPGKYLLSFSSGNIQHSTSIAKPQSKNLA